MFFLGINAACNTIFLTLENNSTSVYIQSNQEKVLIMWFPKCSININAISVKNKKIYIYKCVCVYVYMCVYLKAGIAESTHKHQWLFNEHTDKLDW